MAAVSWKVYRFPIDRRAVRLEMDIMFLDEQKPVYDFIESEAKKGVMWIEKRRFVSPDIDGDEEEIPYRVVDKDQRIIHEGVAIPWQQ